MDDGREVFSELLFGAECTFVANDESSPGLLNDPLDELGAETRETISVGNHNFSVISSLDGCQKPLEPFPFEVEPRCDVLERLVGRVLFFETRLLADKVVFLLARRDTDIDGTLVPTGDSTGLGSRAWKKLLTLSWVPPGVLTDTGDKVSPVPTGGRERLDGTSFCPPSQGVDRHPELTGRFLGALIHGIEFLLLCCNERGVCELRLNYNTVRGMFGLWAREVNCLI